MEVGSAVFLFLETARTLASRLQKKVDRFHRATNHLCVVVEDHQQTPKAPRLTVGDSCLRLAVKAEGRAGEMHSREVVRDIGALIPLRSVHALEVVGHPLWSCLRSLEGSCLFSATSSVVVRE